MTQDLQKYDPPSAKVVKRLAGALARTAEGHEVMQDWHHFVIYDHPKDYPEGFVVRRWRIVHGNPDPVPDEKPFKLAISLREARDVIPPELFCVPRDPADDPCIVESWI